MRYIKEIVTTQIEIDKSIFIGILYPLETIDDNQSFMEDAMKKYPKATHYCSASIFGESMEHMTANDDGEPSRTAGIPILEVLKHHNVTNVLCVVVRYFGGIKLGAGGLVRAYTKACAETIQKATFYQKRSVPSYEIIFNYENINYIDKYLENKGTILDKIYLEKVTYLFLSLSEQMNHLEEIAYLCDSITYLGHKIIYE